MNSKNKSGHESDELRRRAEEIDCENIKQTSEILDELSPEVAWNLIRELRLSQIELELRNEELRREQVERKHTEDALRESELKYRQLFEMESDALFLIDSQSGNLLDVNLAAVALYGYSRDELLNMRHQDLSAEPEETNKETINAGSRGNVLISLRYHRKKDGTVFPVEINSSSLIWKGRPAIMPSIRDITERMQNELEIRDKESFQQALLSNMDAGVMVIDADTQIIENMNRAAALMFGRSEEQVLGRMCMNFLCPAIEGRCPTKDLGQDMDYSERELVRADDTRMPILKSVKRIMLGGREKLLEVFVDITERRNTEEALRRSSEIQTVLRKIAEAAVLSLSLEDLYREIHRLMEQVMPAKNFYINLIDEVNGQIVHPYLIDEKGIAMNYRPIGRHITEYVVRQGRTMLVDDVEFERLKSAGEIDSRFLQFKEWLGAPLRNAQGKVFGVIRLLALEDDPSFQPEDVEVLTIIAAQISMAIEHKHLDEELKFNVKTDKLTGLFNRRHITEKVEVELERYRRTGHEFSVIIADIDDFKSINDMLGHAGGDFMLKCVADEMNQSVRPYDDIGRWGGEEFLCLLPETNIHSAAAAAERMRSRIQQKQFAWEDTVITVSVTFGVSMIKEGDTIDEVITRADKALYQGKRSGKDKVVIFE